jgi:hypothetical protein
MMIVNGLSLPASFEGFLKQHPVRIWDLKETIDAYGQPLVDRHGRPYRVQFRPTDTLEQIEMFTAMMARDFVRMVDPRYFNPEIHERQSADLVAERPGFLPPITDYSQIVQFGRSPLGKPFSFDFRENIQEPTVIYLPKAEIRWRRLAPTFETFRCLLEGYEGE